MKEQGAEAYLRKTIFTPETTLAEICESYLRHRLESITEERIEEMANRCFPDIPHMGDLTMTNRIKWTGARKGMKALLDYLKQPR